MDGGMGLRLGCIADDLTGASDLAGVLVGKGMRTMQAIGVPVAPAPADLDAVVVALKSRTAPVEAAVRDSLAALAWLQEAGCSHIFFKYCSTFDSTPAGNIGPVLTALAVACGADFSIACPAFLENRRSVYQGHLFVGDRLLNESGMENHPLTPMTDSDLVRVLQAQVSGRIGLIPLDQVRADGVAAAGDRLRAQSIFAAIADAVEESDLLTLGRYCATRPLASGASGLGAAIAQAIMGPGAASAPVPLPHVGGRRVVLAGSCSLATRRQVAAMRAENPAYRIALDADSVLDAVIAAACAWFDAQPGDAPLLIYSTADPEDVARQNAVYPGASAALEVILAEIAAHVVGASGVRALIVAGGETSGAVVQRLRVEALRIGPEIDPGVPWTIGLGGLAPEILLALKSGNFGSDSFMLDAWDMLP